MSPAPPTAAALYRQLVGRRSGIIKELYESPPLPGEPEVHSYGGRTCDLHRPGGAVGSTSCGGAGLSREQAMLACFGEALERYCSRFQQDRSCLSTYDQAPSAAVDPAGWALFSDRQYRDPRFPFAPMTGSTALRWTPAESLTERRTKLVPACMVYMPYDAAETEPPIAPSLSTGLSCAPTVAAAALRGLCEVVERDAFAITWLKQVPTWELTDIPEDLRRTFRAGPIEYRVYDLTSDARIPVHLVLSVGNSDWGRLITVGAAAGVEPLAVLRKAFVENAQGRACLMALRRDRPDWRPADDFANVTSFEDHALVLTCRPELLGRAGFLGARGRRPFIAEPPATFHDDQSALAWCARQIDRLGLEALVKEITTEDVARLGLHVVRVMVPGMQPLHGVHRLAFLGGVRLEAAARVFGLDPEVALPPGSFNPIPHPLP